MHDLCRARAGGWLLAPLPAGPCALRLLPLRGHALRGGAARDARELPGRGGQEVRRLLHGGLRSQGGGPKEMQYITYVRVGI